MEDNNLIIYKNNEGNIIVDAIFKAETLWLTQNGMAKVFDVQVPAVSKHLKNIFDEDELNRNSVVSKMEITADDGKSYNTEVYNLDGLTENEMKKACIRLRSCNKERYKIQNNLISVLNINEIEQEELKEFETKLFNFGYKKVFDTTKKDHHYYKDGMNSKVQLQEIDKRRKVLTIITYIFIAIIMIAFVLNIVLNRILPDDRHWTIIRYTFLYSGIALFIVSFVLELFKFDK